jgi:hypothetical protein
MKQGKPFEKLGLASLVLGSQLFLVPMSCLVCATLPQEQQQAQSQQASPPPPAPQTPPQDGQPAAPPATATLGQLPIKRRKVWTNDEVTSLRTPADQYQAEKEQKEAADAAAAAREAAIRAAAKSGKQPPLDIKLPSTVEATEEMLKNTQDDIQETAVVLEKMRKEFLDAPEEQQPDKQKEIDHITAALGTLRRNAKALQDHLQAITPKPPPETPPPPTPPSV